MQAMEISMSGLDVEWQRLQVIANNLANANTSRTADGGSFTPLQLVTGPKMSFDETLAERAQQKMSGVEVYGIEAQRRGTRRVHQPSHPHADADGFVAYPDIDHAGEMTAMIKTSRAYEANLVALNISMQMYSRALELGRQT